MIPLTDKKINLMKSKRYVISAKNSFAMIKIKKKNLNCTKKLEIIVITLENLEQQLIVFAI